MARKNSSSRSRSRGRLLGQADRGKTDQQQRDFEYFDAVENHDDTANDNFNYSFNGNGNRNANGNGNRNDNDSRNGNSMSFINNSILDSNSTSIDNQRMIFSDHNDVIPQFANFDDLPNDTFDQQQKLIGSNSTTTTSNRHHNHNHKHNHSSPIATKEKKKQPSPSTKYKTTTTAKSTASIMADINQMEEFDPEAASDYKWAKMQATTAMAKTLSPVKTLSSNRNSSKIRVPTNAGFVRSISVGSNRSRGGAAMNDSVGGSVSGNGSTNGEYSREGGRRRDRSITPEYKFQQQQNEGRGKTGEKEFYKTRTRSKSPLPPPSTSNNNSSTPTHGNGTRQRNKSASKNINNKNKPIISSSNLKNRNKIPRQNNNHNHNHKHVPQSKEEIQLQKYYASKTFTFQNPLHDLVSYRVCDLASRVAFEQVQPPITMTDLENVVSKQMLGDIQSKTGNNSFGNGNGNTNNNDNSNNHTNKLIPTMSPSMKESRLKKMSPSPQYVEVLNMMNKVSFARQICWSSNVSPEADPFYGWGESDSDSDSGSTFESNNNNDKNDEQNNNLNIPRGKNRTAAERDQRRKILLKRKRRRIAASKIGLRYTQIDQEEYIQNTLLEHAPLLTNVRRRLPMRSDVGFPRATEEEINRKQREVANEAQLEEVSPRLIVLLNNDDVGSSSEFEVDRIIDPDIQKRLKYSLPGMPYASKELMMIRKMQKKSSVVLKENSLLRNTLRVKPDPTSIFAPPVDSVISSAEMWRSRPFLDRPAGMSYAVAIPLDVRFAAGNIEPLVCTLALYCLPKPNPAKKAKLRGKISEDFIFPAGDWGGLLQEKAGEILAHQFGISKESADVGKTQKRRPKQALFSFDPTHLPESEVGRLDSLYLVMNVHKVSHRDAGIAYMNNASIKNSSSRNSISGLFFGSSAGSSSMPSRHHISNAKLRATNAFDAFGSQFLTPFCFGLIPLLPSEGEAYEWPNGVSQSMVMFSHPLKSETHDAFVNRITSISQKTNFQTNVIDEVTSSLSNIDSASFDDDSNILAIFSEDSTNSRGTGSKVRRPKFKFRKRKGSKRPLIDMSDILVGETYLVDGTAIFYTSNIGVDFSQTLLQYPPFLDRESVSNTPFPRLLVDVSGDCAIMVNPDHNLSTRKKRSNLIRLPPSSKSSGYSDSCEVREILYLPFQNDVQYDTGPYLSPRTSLNLLYMYPRLIRKVSTESDNERCDCYSIRIRLVQKKLEIDEDTGAMSTVYVPVESVYNPAPGSESLIQAVYTKIPLSSTIRNSKIDVSAGIPLQDEIKMRLPIVLDGSHFIQFTLYSINLKADDRDSGGLIQSLVGDTYIPLSSSTTKESIHGKRVTTVIPNGLHRIQIGSFQLQIVSRLVSSIHISDPAVATIIRDFASLNGDTGDKNPESSSSSFQLSRMLSKASEQSVYSNFYTLVFIHLRAFVTMQKGDTGHFAFDFKSKRIPGSVDTFSKMENLRSLFKLIAKVKKRLLYVENQIGINRFVKIFFDTFDEEIFHPNSERQNLVESTSSQSTSNISIESDQDLDVLNDKNFKKVESRNSDEVPNKGAKSKMKNYSVDQKILHARYKDNAVPFSRKAYGVSKIDRMKAEAELYETGQILTELYDDDETVVTASTWQSHPHIAPSATSFSIQRPSTAQSVVKAPLSAHLSPEYHPSDTMSVDSDSNSLKLSTPFERARSMARRVNLLAQIFTAPCIAPNLYEGRIQSPVRRKLSRIKRERPQYQEKVGGLIQEYHQYQTQKEKSGSNNIHSCGSDVEDERTGTDISKNNIFSPYPNAPPGARLRGLHHTQPKELIFSVPDGSEKRNNTTGDPFIYEIVLIMWLSSSYQNEQNNRTSKMNQSDSDDDLFMNNIGFLIPLCLKSLVLRCLRTKKAPEVVPSVVLDMKHMLILEPLVKIIAKGFVHQALKRERSTDHVIAEVLDGSNIIIDFFVGLLALIHPSQVSWLIYRYLETLRLCEEDQESNEAVHTELAIRRMRVTRQLRLRAAEKLSSMPRFVALNFPCKYNPYKWEASNGACSWTNQMLDDKDLCGDGLSRSPDKIERLPESNWLAELLSNECFIICSQSCEVIVNGTMSHVTKSSTSSKKKSAMRQRIAISKQDMAHYQSIGYHSISIAYELILRMHATDYRYQSDEARGRIAGIFVSPVIENAVQGVQWLSKLDPSNKIRSVWLLCILYVLQEAPESAIRKQMRDMCTVKSNMKESRLNRFIRILKLCSMTFQEFTNTKYLQSMAPWLVQESFNTISAASIVLVDECYELMSQNPYEQTKMIERTLNLLLHIISSPLSSVTLLRALGTASHVLDKVGSSLFLNAVEDDLQHWGRMIFSLMNNTSLSVRSMAVDLTVSVFGSIFKDGGNIDEVAQVFLTVLPEVVGREIALYSVDGLISSVDSVQCSLWPLRRALADVEEADPIHDDRVDSQLSPFLGQFCRACQAVIDGVLIELRLQGNNCQIINTKVPMLSGKLRKNGVQALPLSWAFDADEESLFEAASFFVPETSPLQRLRWLFTLKRLHEVKGQWVEAGETLILCAKTIAEAIPHIQNVWRPTQFPLWCETSEAPWLSTVGNMTREREINQQVVFFSRNFLEPLALRELITSSSRPSNQKEALTLPQPSITDLCQILTIVSKEAVEMYDKENGMDPLTFGRLESLLKIVMNFVEEHASSAVSGIGRRSVRVNRTQSVEEIAELRKASATINELVTKMAERLLLLVEQQGGPKSMRNLQKKINTMEILFVRVQLMGKKSNRFLESTTIPTFLDWDAPYICRVPSEAVWKAMNSDRIKNAKKNMKSVPAHFIEDEICTTFAEPYIMFLREEIPESNIALCIEIPDEREVEKNETETLYFIVTPVRPVRSSKEKYYQSKKFHCQSTEQGSQEITVANHFPCALSRQSTLITRVLHDATSNC